MGAVGSDAREMIGRTPESIVAIRPMKDGVIADYDTTVAMMKYYIDKALGNNGKPYVMVCVPSGITEVEKRAVIDATRVAGARDAYVIEEPFAAAIGAGLPVMDPTGSMVVDIGGGTTDVATISLGGIVSSRSIRMAGDKMNDAIVQYVRQHMNLLIGERTAEKLKWDIGSASVEAAEEMGTTQVRGRDLVTGLPKTMQVSAKDVSTALQDVVDSIITAIKGTLEETSPEIAADVIDHGIVLTGGGTAGHVMPNLALVPELKKHFDRIVYIGSNGIEKDLAAMLGDFTKCPVTYAGGVGSFEDLRLLKELGKDRINVTIGSALDLFGGPIPYEHVKNLGTNQEGAL